ncbi:MAG: hypothetical protein AAGF50_07460 [Pseudomonadota bacterium]
MRPLELRSVAHFAHTIRSENLSAGNVLVVADARMDAEVPSVNLSEVDDTLLDKVRPTVIVTPLVSWGFDALDVAEALYCAGYTGELVVMASNLPSPKVVERELRDTAPGLCITLSVPDRGNAPH